MTLKFTFFYIFMQDIFSEEIFFQWKNLKYRNQREWLFFVQENIWFDP